MGEPTPIVRCVVRLLLGELPLPHGLLIDRNVEKLCVDGITLLTLVDAPLDLAL